MYDSKETEEAVEYEGFVGGIDAAERKQIPCC